MPDFLAFRSHLSATERKSERLELFADDGGAAPDALGLIALESERRHAAQNPVTGAAIYACDD